MPIYGFKCINEECEVKEFDDWQEMHSEHVAWCPTCKKKGRRIFTFGMFNVDFKPGWDPGLGKWVDTKMQRENTLAEKGYTRIKD